MDFLVNYQLEKFYIKLVNSVVGYLVSHFFRVAILLTCFSDRDLGHKTYEFHINIIFYLL